MIGTTFRLISICDDLLFIESQLSFYNLDILPKDKSNIRNYKDQVDKFPISR